MLQRLPIDISAVCNRDNFNLLSSVIDQVEDAVVTNSDTIGLLTVKLLDTKRSGISFEGKEFILHPVK